MEKHASLQTTQIFLPEKEVITIVCYYLNIEKDELFGLSRNRSLAKKRILLANYFIKYSKINITHVAKLFQRTHGTLSRQIADLVKQPEKYFPLKILQNIEKTIICKAALNSK